MADNGDKKIRKELEISEWANSLQDTVISYQQKEIQSLKERVEEAEWEIGKEREEKQANLKESLKSGRDVGILQKKNKELKKKLEATNEEVCLTTEDFLRLQKENKELKASASCYVDKEDIARLLGCCFTEQFDWEEEVKGLKVENKKLREELLHAQDWINPEDEDEIFEVASQTCGFQDFVEDSDIYQDAMVDLENQIEELKKDSLKKQAEIDELTHVNDLMSGVAPLSSGVATDGGEKYVHHQKLLTEIEELKEDVKHYRDSLARQNHPLLLINNLKMFMTEGEPQKAKEYREAVREWVKNDRRICGEPRPQAEGGWKEMYKFVEVESSTADGKDPEAKESERRHFGLELSDTWAGKGMEKSSHEPTATFSAESPIPREKHKFGLKLPDEYAGKRMDMASMLARGEDVGGLDTE
jgi:hypothetical protein